MIRGLVIGKFLPVHEGHLALIEYSALRCDHLIVSMTFTSSDPIPWQLRQSWLLSLTGKYQNVTVEVSVDDFDDDKLSLPERMLLWSAFVRNRFLPIDIVFSSEEYGQLFANAIGAKHELFDISRSLVPVSGTQIRHDAFRYWQYIPAVVRPYFVKKICFYGPESTGKSTMARQMAKFYQTEYVPEVAREIVTTNRFSVEDIIEIGKAQNRRIEDKAKVANKILCCDTDLITTQIYSDVYLNQVPQILYDLESQVHYVHYFLFDIDVPWVPDHIRDMGNKREEMFANFKNALEIRGIQYQLIRGNWDERLHLVQTTIELILDSKSE